MRCLVRILLLVLLVPFRVLFPKQCGVVPDLPNRRSVALSVALSRAFVSVASGTRIILYHTEPRSISYETPFRFRRFYSTPISLKWWERFYF